MRGTDEIRTLMSSADPAAQAATPPGATAPELIVRAAEPGTAVRRGARHRRTWSVVGAAAVTMAAAAAIVVPVVSDHGVRPAYAVTVQEDGWVRVEIEALNDAADFQQQLKQAGVPTEIEYLPAGMHCADRGVGTSLALGFQYHPRGDHTVKLTRFLVDPDQFGPGQTLVVETHGTRVTGWYIAEAPHQCQPVLVTPGQVAASHRT